MKKRTKVIVVLLVVMTMFLGIAGVVFAREGRATMEVLFRNIQIQVDGIGVPIPEGSEPFIYQGRTFVPLRLIAEALGEKVHWDGANFTVQIGDTPGGTFLSALRPFSTQNIREMWYDVVANMDIAGERYHKGIRFRVHGIWRGPPGETIFNLDGQHTRLTGLVGFDDSSPSDVESVSFYGDDRLLQVVTIRRGELPQPVDIDLRGVLLLRISFTRNTSADYHVNLVNMLLE